MNLNELQKVWDSQNNKPMYVIREEALHNRILTKGKNAEKKASYSEWMLIFTGFIAAGIIVVFDFLKHGEDIFSYVGVVLFSMISVYSIIKRILRKTKTQNFERSILGDLEYALSIAQYQVSLSKAILYGFWPATFLLSMLSLIFSNHSIWFTIFIGILFVGITYASFLEHKYYVRKKEDLVSLKVKLIEEPETD